MHKLSNIDFTAERTLAKLFKLENRRGMSLSVSDYGATITSLKIPVNGELVDIVAGFDSLEGYIKSESLPAQPYFGAIVGRWSGRIDKGEFSLNGKKYKLERNNGGNSLHGGPKGFSRVIWSVIDSTDNSLTLQYVSPDGDEGFPGELTTKVTYTLSDDALEVFYEATSTDDTIVNLTQHSYFNLDGHQSDVSGQQLFIDTDRILETQSMIPTGRFIDITNTDGDFRRPKDCPQQCDISFILNNSNGPSATLFNPKNGLKMSVYTDQPSLHVYVGGNCFGKIKGKDGAEYHPLSGICFEAQNFPDAPNHPNFPNPILRKGEKYTQTTIFKFETAS